MRKNYKPKIGDIVEINNDYRYVYHIVGLSPHATLGDRVDIASVLKPKGSTKGFGIPVYWITKVIKET